MPDEKYQYGIDFERVAAIDIHTHVEVDGHGNKAYDDELVEAVGKYFKMAPGALSSVDALADEYRGVPAADLAEAQVAVVVDVRHVQPDLVDVTNDDECWTVARPANARDRGPDAIGGDLGEARASLAPDPRGIGLVAGWSGRTQQAVQELGHRHGGEA